MNRKEFFKVSAAASLASLLSPLSAYAEKFESEGKKVKVAVIGCDSFHRHFYTSLIAIHFLLLLWSLDPNLPSLLKWHRHLL